MRSSKAEHPVAEPVKGGPVTPWVRTPGSVTPCEMSHGATCSRSLIKRYKVAVRLWLKRQLSANEVQEGAGSNPAPAVFNTHGTERHRHDPLPAPTPTIRAREWGARAQQTTCSPTERQKSASASNKTETDCGNNAERRYLGA